jgi:hypothetical protein
MKIARPDNRFQTDAISELHHEGAIHDAGRAAEAQRWAARRTLQKQTGTS